MRKYQFCLLLISVLLLTVFAACNNNDQKPVVKEEKKKTVVITDLPKEQIKSAPIINILDTVALKRIVLCTKDSAATSERIGLKLADIYGVKLTGAMKKLNVKATGAPMAWYKGQKAPFFFEAGIPVNKMPGKLPKGFFIKETGKDSVIVAHFFGPYNLTSECYDAVKDILKDRKKKAAAPPYEIYVTDPIDENGKPKDPYKVQTDIIFPWK